MMDIRSSAESQLDFSLLIQQNNLSLQNTEYTLDTDVTGFGFQVVDIPPSLPIHIGFGIGYAFIDQQIIPGLNNATMGGLYFTILARTELFAAQSWSSEVIFAYDYLTAEKSSETQKSRLRWNHFSAEANVNYFFTSYLSLRLGGVYGLLDAKLTGSGDNNTSLNLDAGEHLAAFASMGYHVADQQKLTITVQQGYYDRFIIQFQRTFY
ncbi:MAG: hypothetical protein AMJ53_08355 [Gammaproteobacteria bacterium SG8_11]|nr:MAG: hypothetical protein AMJ53_08355 [Gammaproteobacteria bacterium SG8_11]